MDNEKINGSTQTTGLDDDIYIIEDETAAGEPMGFFTRLISIFASPGRLMENIKEFPKLGAPTLYILIFALFSALIAMPLVPITADALSLAIAERYGVDFLNMTQAVQTAGQFSVISLISSWLSVTITMLAGAAIGALFILLLTKIMRGNATFKHYFSVLLHTSTLGLVGGIISSGIMIATGSFMTFTSLAPILMPTGNVLMPAFNLLSAIELFSIWSAVLLIIGVKKINDGFSTAKAVTAGIIYYAASLGVSTAMASLTGLGLDAAYRAMQQL